jgi:putative phosphoribosyl transferase
MFADRTAAGRQLAARLTHLKGRKRSVVLALPRGGVAVAAEIARALEAPLDLVLVRKIGAPGQRELAIGAVAEGEPPEVLLDTGAIGCLDVAKAYIDAETERQVREIARRRGVYRRAASGSMPAPIDGRTVVVVDDGLATGSTMRAALHAVRRRNPARVVLAVPVAPADTLEALRPEVDEIVCLETPDPFLAIGLHYADFHQLDDTEVIGLLADAAGAAAPKQ